MANNIVQLKDDASNNLYPCVHIDSIYPIGSIYLSVNNTSPSLLFGGTWVQIAQGRTLFGAGTLNGNTYTANSNVEAGLPNLSGGAGRSYSDYNLNNSEYAQFVTGPFWYRESESWGTSSNTSAGSNDACRNIHFDASIQNPIYGNSTTVQPPAFVVYMWQRTA